MALDEKLIEQIVTQVVERLSTGEPPAGSAKTGGAPAQSQATDGVFEDMEACIGAARQAHARHAARSRSTDPALRSGCHLPTGVPRRRRGRPRPWLREPGRARSTVAGGARGLGGQLTGVFGTDVRVCKPQQTGARGIPKASTSGAVLRPRRGCGCLQCNRATRRRSERLFPRRRKPPARLAPVMALA